MLLIYSSGGTVVYQGILLGWQGWFSQVIKTGRIHFVPAADNQS